MTESDFEDTPAAVAGRSRLEARLERLTAQELETFWEAVRRCYAATSDEA